MACWLLGANATATIVAAIVAALIALPLLMPPFRLPFITTPLLGFYTKILPPLSDTERVALEAGTVGFEGELFSGKPDWDVLLSQPKPALTADEQAFLDGPCEELCRMTNDWEITHVRADLPPELWDFLKKNKFFGMIIAEGIRRPGLLRAGATTRSSRSWRRSPPCSAPPSACPTRSARPNCCCTTAPTSRRTTTCRAWPTAAKCRASRLTGPSAGSDATSIPDYGIVCDGRLERRARGRRDA